MREEDAQASVKGRPLPDRIVRTVLRFDRLLVHPLMPAALGLAAFVLFALTANLSGHLMNDAWATSLASWRLGSAHTLDLTPWAGNAWIVPADGRWVSNRLPGSIYWNAPFYALMNHSGPQSPLPGAVASSTSAAIAVGFLFATFRRFSPPRCAFGATALIVFGTSTWTVSSGEILTHGPDQMLLAISMYCVTYKRWWLAGLSYAGAITVRPHTAVIAACAGIAGSISERSIKPALKVAVTSALGAAALYGYHKIAYGSATLLADYQAPAAAAAQASNWLQTPTDLLGNLFSLSRGIFVLSPFLLLLVPGLVHAWKVAPAWIRGQAIGGVLYLLIQLSGNVFWGGNGFYGYRLQIEALTVASPLLILCWQEWTCKARWRRLAFWALGVVAVLQYSIGAFAYVPGHSEEYAPWSSWLVIQAWHYGTRSGFLWALLTTGLFSLVVYVFARTPAPAADPMQPNIQTVPDHSV